MKIQCLLPAILISLALPLAAAAQDEEQAAADDIQAQMKQDKTGTNPLNFTFDARLYNEFQWLNTAGDGEQNITTLELRAPFAGGKWQFRGKVRGVNLEADINDDGIDDLDDSGFGDTDLRFMTIPYMKKFGVATGVEFFLNTASEDVLGTGTDVVAPFVFVAIFNPIGKGSIFVPGYQHKISVDEDKGRAKVNQGLIDMFLVKTFRNNEIWAFIDPQILLDYENDIEFMLFEMQAGMMLDKYFGTKGHSAWIMPSFGVGTHRPYDYSFEIGYKLVW
jgi:hypothetical protein